MMPGAHIVSVALCIERHPGYQDTGYLGRYNASYATRVGQRRNNCD